MSNLVLMSYKIDNDLGYEVFFSGSPTHEGICVPFDSWPGLQPLAAKAQEGGFTKVKIITRSHMIADYSVE